MSIPARLSLSLVSTVLIAAAIVGCSKEKEEPVVLAVPSATVAPVKATQDPAPPQPVAATGSAGTGTEAAVAQPADVAPPPATDAPKAAPPKPIDDCCSALAAMTKDAKLDTITKSKATAASAMCGGMAKLVKDGKTQRTQALTQIKATMAGKAPAACN